MKSKFFLGIIFSAALLAVREKINAQCPYWPWANEMAGDSANSYGTSVIFDPTGNGNVYIAGGFQGTVDFDPGPEMFNLTSESNHYGIFISKLNSSGNLLLAKAMTGTAGEGYAYSIAIDPTGSGAIYTTGHFNGTIDFDPGEGIRNLTSALNVCSSFPFCGDIFISKLDSIGNLLWAKVIGGPEDDIGNSIAIDPRNGDVYTAGYFKGTVDFDPGSNTFNLTSVGAENAFISKLSRNGNFIWAKALSGIGGNGAYAIAFDPEGSGAVYTTGYFNGTVDFNPGEETFALTSGGSTDMFISKLDSAGHFVWAKAMGGTGTNEGYSLALDLKGKGDIYTTGHFSGKVDFDPGTGIADTFKLTSAGSTDMFISKLNREGSFVWAKAMGGIIGGAEGFSIAIDLGGKGDVYTTGEFTRTVDFDPGDGIANLISAGGQDIFISKIDSSGNFDWAKSMGGTAKDNGNAITVDASGDAYVAGTFHSHGISFGTITLTNPDALADAFIAKIGCITSVVLIDATPYQINIFPNPATNELTIGIDGDELFHVDITLFNVLGEIVFADRDGHISHEKTIDISALPTGIYFMELNIDGKIVTEKVVKE